MGIMVAWPLLPLLLACVATSLHAPGDRMVIPEWRMQSTSIVGSDPDLLSRAGARVSSWYCVGSRATVLGGLMDAGALNESEVFYSDNLSHIDKADFKVPWIYRAEFPLGTLAQDEHLFLNVHGISSRADIFFNGANIASRHEQVGAYGGRSYDLSQHVHHGQNVLLIKAYPTDYKKDLAVGWVDWNPNPPDSGMGVWRTVDLKLTGPVSLSSPRVITTIRPEDLLHSSDWTPHAIMADVRVKTDVVNHGNAPAECVIRGTITAPNRFHPITFSRRVQLRPQENSTIELDATVKDAQLWWPAHWGGQPLYRVEVHVELASGALSDIAPPTQFGIRTVDSSLNDHGDRVFEVNGRRFHVRGAGYAADLFLRFDMQRLESIFRYVLDLGLNTVRLEGKQEHPELYELADRMGLMLVAGWECCDKWEPWNSDANATRWDAGDYRAAHQAMLHEAEMMQPHPSLLAFLIGSDYAPDVPATDGYLNALQRMDWPNPIVASASRRGHPPQLPPSGMKMDGPYDWVPPNYWYGADLGAASGFGSEQGAGVGTPELPSLYEFLSPEDLKRLWSSPAADLYHLSPPDSPFSTRKIYNEALAHRYGRPTSLADYVWKSQIMDYEATRAEFEAFGVRQSNPHPATGVIYWMLNSAWPSLHWQLFDYYLRPAGAYYGAKVGLRLEHVAYDYERKQACIVNHSRRTIGARRIRMDLLVNGTGLVQREVTVQTGPGISQCVSDLAEEVAQIQGVGFLRLMLYNEAGALLSRNVYWLAATVPALNWAESTWYHTPVNQTVDFSSLIQLPPATVDVQATEWGLTNSQQSTWAQLTVQNRSPVPAFFTRLKLLDASTRKERVPVFWSDNYVTLFPQEELQVTVEVAGDGPLILQWDGVNVQAVEKACPLMAVE
ncbi:glycoside hydrolase superfamily [Aspergillus egyptiacus]|nr:glycoside hydrolase superfamily [Aspergillus egyptiacus]